MGHDHTTTDLEKDDLLSAGHGVASEDLDNALRTLARAHLAAETLDGAAREHDGQQGGAEGESGRKELVGEGS